MIHLVFLLLNNGGANKNIVSLGVDPVNYIVLPFLNQKNSETIATIHSDNILIWLGRQDYKVRPVLYPSGRAAHVQNCSRQFCRTCYGSHPAALQRLPYYEATSQVFQIWLGRQDSNLRMPGSKPGALPLGDGPIFLLFIIYKCFSGI